MADCQFYHTWLWGLVWFWQRYWSFARLGICFNNEREISSPYPVDVSVRRIDFSCIWNILSFYSSLPLNPAAIHFFIISESLWCCGCSWEVSYYRKIFLSHINIKWYDKQGLLVHIFKIGKLFAKRDPPNHISNLYALIEYLKWFMLMLLLIPRFTSVNMCFHTWGKWIIPLFNTKYQAGS